MNFLKMKVFFVISDRWMMPSKKKHGPMKKKEMKISVEKLLVQPESPQRARIYLQGYIV